MENYLLGCDWGTSSFRLGLFNLSEGGLVGEIQSRDGISGIHRNWQNGNYTHKGITKNHLFRENLLNQIGILSKKTALKLENTPILISGMASSSIGIEDIPYADMPFRLDGSQVKSRRYEVEDEFPHEIILISGVQSENDVMRGEETQMIGIWSLLMDRGSHPKEAVFIFPGTHSKHVYVRGAEMIQFKSYMTGEMYQVIGSHSILKDSVKISDEHYASESDLQAFKTGVKKSREYSILNGMFNVRTNQLFNRLNKIQNAYYLSGLLIGNELNDLVKKQDCPLFLCSGKNLYELYKLALEELHLSSRTNFVDIALVESAAMTGQKIIYDQYVNNKLLNE